MPEDVPPQDPEIIEWDRRTTERSEKLRGLADSIEERLPKDDDAIAAVANIRAAADQAESTIIGYDAEITYRTIPSHSHSQDYEVQLLGEMWAMLRHEDAPTRRRIVVWLGDRIDEDATGRPTP